MADSDMQDNDKVLRAKDVVPPYNRENNPQSPRGPAAADNDRQNLQIPKFDLAEQIMAEHRKSASTKRKKPGKTADTSSPEPTPPPYDSICRQIHHISSESQQVIAEIVARDIQKLRRINTNPSR